MDRKLRMGMIGGGKNAFIGAIHRIAANMDGLIEVVCGALSSDPEKALDSGRSIFLDEERIYLTYEEMFQKERLLPADQRMDFVTIVTPNFAHFAPAMMALEYGFSVVIEKPVTIHWRKHSAIAAKAGRNRPAADADTYVFRIPDGKGSTQYNKSRKTRGNQKGNC